MKRICWSTRSCSEVLTPTSKISSTIDRWRVNIQRNLDKLTYVPSGFRCKSIILLTLVMGVVGNISGGCSGMTSHINTNGAATRRGLSEVRGMMRNVSVMRCYAIYFHVNCIRKFVRMQGKGVRIIDRSVNV